ncbi:MAG: trypsin-like peptidase domain-containing protein [Candidatus Acidiferrales bacterium]
MFCSKCGKEIPLDSQFCPKCGQALTGLAPKQPRSKRSPIVPVLALLTMVAVGIFAWQFFVRKPPAAPSFMLKPFASSSASPKSSAPPAPRVLSGEEIFRMASGGMVLIETYDAEGRKRGQGSGFIVSPNGLALTNYHVIRGASRATAKFSDGTLSDVSGVVGYDPVRDVAVIKLDSPRGEALQMGDSNQVQVGEKIVAIGSPLGLQNTLSEGIVSGLRGGLIQMSDPISPGSSGGAVFDKRGKVIGISVATLTKGQNMNFAVPINWAKPYLRGGTPKTLADVAAENTLVQDVLSGSTTVPAAHARLWHFSLNPNVMSNAEIQGQVSSTGGLGGKISLDIVFAGQPIYQCRATACEIHQNLVAPGIYTVVLDNRASPIFSRTVSGEIALKFVK